MKRFFFSAIALMVAATACTESGLIDTPDFYGNAIVFDTYVGRTPVTKAVNCDDNYLKTGTNKGVKIYAYYQDPNTNAIDYSEPFMDGALYYNSGWAYYAGSETSTATDMYWPSEKKLAFMSYNLNAASCITENADNPNIFDFEIKESPADQKDLLVSVFNSVAENTNGDTQVSLQYYHLLSRVGFKVLPTNKNDAEIKIHSIKLWGNFPKNGMVDMTSTTPAIQPYKDADTQMYYSLLSKTFTTTGNECVEQVEGVDTIVAKPIDVSDNEDRYMMIMPGSQPGAYIEVEYSVGEDAVRYSKIELEKVTGTGENIQTEDWEFEAGHAYEFIFKIHTAAIEFSAEVFEGDWNNPSSEAVNPAN